VSRGAQETQARLEQRQRQAAQAARTSPPARLGTLTAAVAQRGQPRPAQALVVRETPEARLAREEAAQAEARRAAGGLVAQAAAILGDAAADLRWDSDGRAHAAWASGIVKALQTGVRLVDVEVTLGGLHAGTIKAPAKGATWAWFAQLVRQATDARQRDEAYQAQQARLARPRWTSPGHVELAARWTCARLQDAGFVPRGHAVTLTEHCWAPREEVRAVLGAVADAAVELHEARVRYLTDRAEREDVLRSARERTREWLHVHRQRSAAVELERAREDERLLEGQVAEAHAAADRAMEQAARDILARLEETR
jgi:hypothetical protein